MLAPHNDKLQKPMLPVDIVLHPSWWYRHTGITFDEDFFFHPARRVEAERKMEQTLHERWGRYGHFLLDEPRGAMATLSKKIGEVIKSVNPEILTGVTHADASVLGPMIDIYMAEYLGAGYKGLRGAPQPDLPDVIRKAGVKEWWTYRNSLQSVFAPDYVRWAAGWQAERVGFGGVTCWTYVQAMGDPLTDLDSRDWGVVLEGEHGPIPTIAFEAWREGVDDMRYLATLHHACAGTSDAGVKTRARQLIKSVIAKQPWSSKDVKFTDKDQIQLAKPPRPYAWYDSIRRQMAGLILKANATSKKP